MRRPWWTDNFRLDRAINKSSKSRSRYKGAIGRPRNDLQLLPCWQHLRGFQSSSLATQKRLCPCQ